MRGPVSPDAVLAAHPAGDGRAAMSFERGVFDESLVKRLAENDPAIKWLGRSLLGQLGCDLLVDDEVIVNDGKAFVPVRFNVFTDLAQALKGDLQELVELTSPGESVRWRDKALAIGRFVDMSRLVRLEFDEVQKDIDECMICFDDSIDPEESVAPNYMVNDNGSISVQLEPIEFRFNKIHLLGTAERPSPRERRIDLLPRGRSAAARHTDDFERCPDDPLPEFLLGGIRFSPGGRYWKVREQISPHVTQLASAALFDGDRLAGSGKHLDKYDSLRQIELNNKSLQNGRPSPTFADTQVTVDLYRSNAVGGATHTATNWLRMTKEARRRRHVRGVTALEALETGDEASQQALMREVGSSAVTALILSRRGVDIVPESGSAKHNARNIQNALRNIPMGIPSSLEHLEPLVENLQMAGDRTATVVADKIRIKDIPNHVESGARAIFAEQFVAQNGALSDGELAILSQHSRQSIGLAQMNYGGYREFHPTGLWLKTGVAERLEDVELGLAIFGARRPWIGQAFDAQLGEFFDGLVVDFDGPQKIAVIHGGGGGVMFSACENARARGILSLATGISKEEISSIKADGSINMETIYWIVRQHQLDTHTSVPIILPGGFGTGAEVYNALTSRKLLIRRPGPMFFVDPYDEFAGTRAQINQMSEQSADPNAPRRWVKNTVHSYKDFDGVREMLRTFRSDMPAYWEQAGIPSVHVAKSFQARRRLSAETAMPISVAERDAVRSYFGRLPELDEVLA